MKLACCLEVYCSYQYLFIVLSVLLWQRHFCSLLLRFPWQKLVTVQKQAKRRGKCATNIWGLEHFGELLELHRYCQLVQSSTTERGEQAVCQRTVRGGVTLGIQLASLMRNVLRVHRRQAGNGSETCQQAFCLRIVLPERTAGPSAVR